MAMGRMAWLLFALCLAYVIAAVILPLSVLLLTSFERFATVILPQAEFTLANYEAAFGFAAVDYDRQGIDLVAIDEDIEWHCNSSLFVNTRRSR